MNKPQVTIPVFDSAESALIEAASQKTSVPPHGVVKALVFQLLQSESQNGDEGTGLLEGIREDYLSRQLKQSSTVRL